MKQEVMDLVIGSLLHDIGKMLHRYNDGRNHAISGYDFLKDKTELNDKNILEQIKYHHVNLLRSAKLSSDSLAYITYIADNIASMADRRKKDEEGYGFAKDIPLDSVFNILNGNKDTMHYEAVSLESDEINYPTKKECKYTDQYYRDCLENIRDCINGLNYSEGYVNSLLEVLEANMSFVPSSTAKAEIADISLFDHVKITAAISCCIYNYMNAFNRNNYKDELLKESKKFYDEKAFLLYSIDISGIQDFIYTISTSKALKNLRSRSFYLEIMMEHIVDELLVELGLSRVNLIYCGGGHAYMLLPNTQETCKKVEVNEARTNRWFMENFGTALFIAGGYAECSSNDLQNNPKGSYAAMFRIVSNRISEKKLQRYSKDEIIFLNNKKIEHGDRECTVCHTSNSLTEENKCEVCSGLEKFSKFIQYKTFFTIVEKPGHDDVLPLPHGRYLIADTEDSLKIKMKEERYIRSYCKNNYYTGENIATKIWVGDYQSEKGETFEHLAREAHGIKRLGVIRADIDNLGQAFVSGFDENFVSLSRTAAFSRKLSHFFKRNINYLLKNAVYDLRNEQETRDDLERVATIVYSGGDDVFIVGAWDEVLGLAVDLNEALEYYTQGTLSISAGFGLYDKGYPLSAMAREVGELEGLSKSTSSKNSITLFNEEHTYTWDQLINDVIEDKYRTIEMFLRAAEDKGKGFLYKLLDYLRNREEKINLARYAYLLARIEPEKTASDSEKEAFREFSKTIYQWILDEDECKQAITAIYLYIYWIRESEGKNEN